MKAPSPSALAELSVQERLALIEQLWDSLEDSDVPVTPAQAAELDRRLALRQQTRSPGVTWEQLRAELEQRRR